MEWGYLDFVVQDKYRQVKTGRFRKSKRSIIPLAVCGIYGCSLMLFLFLLYLCEYPVKKVSEEEPCQLCAAFVGWAGEQYEESYRDGRYPEEVRQAIEKDLYKYKGKPPLCIINPYWPKAKDRMRRARPRWELKEAAGEEREEESSEKPGLLQGGQSISMETVEERRSRETAGTPPEVSAVETPAGTPQIQTALENTQKTLRTAKDQKSQQRRQPGSRWLRLK